MQKEPLQQEGKQESEIRASQRAIKTQWTAVASAAKAGSDLFFLNSRKASLMPSLPQFAVHVASGWRLWNFGTSFLRPSGFIRIICTFLVLY